ncbi:hypothetical protein CC80DRAFT_201334 [Byssothecium circinans]|uniref:Uncharacterized protein n=1 Tax=Byssothecium circinans TaxID=147558 RepID=A0A6A5UDF2_9PLEO|nr:hypothetical protein CC80DRAFT_201334 [Byssothecium circinans]
MSPPPCPCPCPYPSHVSGLAHYCAHIMARHTVCIGVCCRASSSSSLRRRSRHSPVGMKRGALPAGAAACPHAYAYANAHAICTSMSFFVFTIITWVR